MLACNRRECVKRMLESGEYQTLKYRSQEEQWLIYYLQKDNVPIEEIYNIWYTFYIKRNECTKDDDNPRKTFILLLKRIKPNYMKDKYKTIVIYEDEINHINNIKCARWAKEALLIMIAWFKQSGESTEVIPVIDIFKFVKRPKKSAKSNKELIDIALNNGILKIEKKIEIVKDTVDISNDARFFESVEYFDTYHEEEREVYNYSLNTNGKNTIIKTNFIFDILDYFDLIKMEKTCTCCGKKFEYNMNTQRDICEECWNKERGQKNIDRLKNSVRKTPDKRATFKYRGNNNE